MRPDGFSPPGIPKKPPSAKSCIARASSPPLYERGAIRIPTSVTVEGLNACSFEYPPGLYQIGMTIFVIRSARSPLTNAGGAIGTRSSSPPPLSIQGLETPVPGHVKRHRGPLWVGAPEGPQSH